MTGARQVIALEESDDAGNADLKVVGDLMESEFSPFDGRKDALPEIV
jgi:hypothetical protein